MKKAFLIIFALLLGFILWLLWCNKNHAPRTGSSTNMSSSEGLKSSNTSTNLIRQTITSSISTSTSNDEYILSLSAKDYYALSSVDRNLDWKMPINFWGRVLDENENPVAKANVHFVWTILSDPAIPNGVKQADVVTDESGAFSLDNERGKRLSVAASKEGYYSTSSARQSFEYAQPDIRFVPDKNNPIVFHLRKKGVGNDLITSAFGMSGDFQVHVPRDGTPTQVDLLRRTQGGSGQLQLSELKPEHTNWQQASQWTFKVEIPSGGLVSKNEEFPFEAPESGYVSALEFQFQKGENWTTNLKTNFYVKFGTPPVYGWIQVETGISYGGAILTYAINPNGSRNLEPK